MCSRRYVHVGRGRMRRPRHAASRRGEFAAAAASRAGGSNGGDGGGADADTQDGDLSRVSCESTVARLRTTLPFVLFEEHVLGEHVSYVSPFMTLRGKADYRRAHEYWSRNVPKSLPEFRYEVVRFFQPSPRTVIVRWKTSWVRNWANNAFFDWAAGGTDENAEHEEEEGDGQGLGRRGRADAGSSSPTTLPSVNRPSFMDANAMRFAYNFRVFWEKLDVDSAMAQLFTEADIPILAMFDELFCDYYARCLPQVVREAGRGAKEFKDELRSKARILIDRTIVRDSVANDAAAAAIATAVRRNLVDGPADAAAAQAASLRLPIDTSVDAVTDQLGEETKLSDTLARLEEDLKFALAALDRAPSVGKEEEEEEAPTPAPIPVAVDEVNEVPSAKLHESEQREGRGIFRRAVSFFLRRNDDDGASANAPPAESDGERALLEEVGRMKEQAETQQEVKKAEEKEEMLAVPVDTYMSTREKVAVSLTRVTAERDRRRQKVDALTKVSKELNRVSMESRGEEEEVLEKFIALMSVVEDVLISEMRCVVSGSTRLTLDNRGRIINHEEILDFERLSKASDEPTAVATPKRGDSVAERSTKLAQSVREGLVESLRGVSFPLVGPVNRGTGDDEVAAEEIVRFAQAMRLPEFNPIIWEYIAYRTVARAWLKVDEDTADSIRAMSEDDFNVAFLQAVIFTGGIFVLCAVAGLYTIWAINTQVSGGGVGGGVGDDMFLADTGANGSGMDVAANFRAFVTMFFGGGVGDGSSTTPFGVM